MMDDSEVLETVRHYAPHWCDRCAIFYGENICPLCDRDDRGAEIEKLRMALATANGARERVCEVVERRDEEIVKLKAELLATYEGVAKRCANEEQDCCEDVYPDFTCHTTAGGKRCWRASYCAIYAKLHGEVE